MVDTFPGLQSDANTIIRKANELTLLARRLRSDAARGDGDAVRATCAEIGRCGPPMLALCEAVAETAQHFVEYTSGEG